MVILNVSEIKATRGSEERVACFVNCSEDASLIVCSMLLSKRQLHTMFRGDRVTGCPPGIRG